MKWIKKLALGFLAVTTVFVLAACGQKKADDKTISVGIMANDREIWQDIQKRLAKEDVKIKLVEFTDYNTPNNALEAGDIQLNAFQHHVFLDAWNEKKNTKIVAIGDTYLAPIRAYSKKIKSIKDLKDGDSIAIPNDAANETRALGLLQDQGFITLKKGVKQPTKRDIETNRLNLKITELDASQTAAALDDSTVAIINNDVASAANLDPKSAIAIEKLGDTAKPYVNFIAAKSAADKDNKDYQKIVAAYQSPETAKLIEKVYKGSATPAWNQKK